jgi:hypothetical protein
MKTSELFEKMVLFDYLRNNLSTRKICKKYREINDPTGFKSHNILKKFSINKQDKGKLFLFSKKEALCKIERFLKRGRVSSDSVFEPKKFKKYKNLYVLAKNENALYCIMNGELRNLIQYFFKERKSQYAICQYKDCRNKNLDVAHHHRRNRKRLFMIAASKNRIKNKGHYKFDIFRTIIDFLNLHRNNAVFFLCKKHHKMYDQSKNKGDFLKKIEQ